MRILLTILAVACASSPSWAARAPAAYDYPIADPYDATVIGTPAAFRAKLPETIPARQYRLPAIGKVPDLFWYNEELRFSAALQKRAAPLVFIIAGTGAGHNSAKMVSMQKALYQSGFHVINVGSPTELNFQVSASTSHTPGYVADDVADLYRVMQQAYQLVREKKNPSVTGVHIAGYSLGALHAAFLAELDQREQKLGLRKVYMINPPVSLYDSAVILDGFFARNIPVVDGVPVVGRFLDKVITGLARSYDPARGMTFNGDFLYTAYVDQREHGIFRTDTAPEGLIGFSFRMTSSAMVFAADIMTQAGYIVPRNKDFTTDEALAPYERASMLVTFQEYVNDLVIPAALARHPGKTRDDVIRESSLRTIEGFLKSNPDVRVATNRDEIILAPGELAYLESLMGDRMKIYPEGGHCGNIDYPVNVGDMVAFFEEASAQ